MNLLRNSCISALRGYKNGTANFKKDFPIWVNSQVDSLKLSIGIRSLMLMTTAAWHHTNDEIENKWFVLKSWCN
jgi:hypothetical protein